MIINLLKKQQQQQQLDIRSHNISFTPAIYLSEKWHVSRSTIIVKANKFLFQYDSQQMLFAVILIANVYTRFLSVKELLQP